MIDHDRIAKLKRYLSDWRMWGEAAAIERDRLLTLDASRREINDTDTAMGELLQRHIQSLDATERECSLAGLRITAALGRAEAGQG